MGAGFTASLARPGENITWLTSETGLEIVGKYLETMPKDLLLRADQVVD